MLGCCSLCVIGCRPHFSLPSDNVQVLKLLEILEVKMILDVKRKVQKEVTLTLAERGRDESAALPTDLWKRVVGRSLFTALLGRTLFAAVVAKCPL